MMFAMDLWFLSVEINCFVKRYIWTIINDCTICISYNTGKSALPDIYAQCPRAQSA